MSDEKPTKESPHDDDPYVWYFFEVTGVSYGQYCEEDNCFYGARGYLIGDATHWMPAPKPPALKLPRRRRK